MTDLCNPSSPLAFIGFDYPIAWVFAHHLQASRNTSHSSTWGTILVHRLLPLSTKYTQQTRTLSGGLRPIFRGVFGRLRGARRMALLLSPPPPSSSEVGPPPPPPGIVMLFYLSCIASCLRMHRRWLRQFVLSPFLLAVSIYLHESSLQLLETPMCVCMPDSNQTNQSSLHASYLYIWIQHAGINLFSVADFVS